MIFDAPIPGESLTVEPKSMPYERPPEIVDPLKALDKHIENLEEPGSMEDALFFLEMGVDLVSLTEGILRSAVMEGIHSIDVSLIIAPVLHEYIRKHAIGADIEFDEGLENPEEDEAIQYERDVMRANKLLKKLRNLDDLEEEEEEVLPAPEPQAQMMTEEETMPEEAVEEAPKGLMARV